MADPTYKALYRIGPVRYTTPIGSGEDQTEQFAVDITSTQAAGTDLSAVAPSSLRGAYLSLQAETGDMYVAFAAVASEVTAALDGTARSGSSQCGFRLYAGQPPEEFCVPQGCQYLHARAVSASGVLRGFVSSPVTP